MSLVRVLKSLGFEQVGEIVDYRAVDLEERLANGDLEVLSADPREVVNSESNPDSQPAPEVTLEEVAPEVVDEPVVEAPIVETPVVEQPIVDQPVQPEAPIEETPVVEAPVEEAAQPESVQPEPIVEGQ